MMHTYNFLDAWHLGVQENRFVGMCLYKLSLKVVRYSKYLVRRLWLMSICYENLKHLSSNARTSIRIVMMLMRAVVRLLTLTVLCISNERMKFVFIKVANKNSWTQVLRFAWQFVCIFFVSCIFLVSMFCSQLNLRILPSLCHCFKQ